MNPVALTLLLALTAEPVTFSVELKGVQTQRKGKVVCALFVSEAGFPMDATAAAQLVEARFDDKGARCTFMGVKPGPVAISVSHDENANGVVDKNFLGIPLEGWASSKNVKPAFRAPTFAESQFVPSKEALMLELHY
jgi:uncharacterized protein (DUF2141 family)